MGYITRQQQEYAHALMKDISKHSGYLSNALGYEAIKARYMEAIDDEFSLKLTKCTSEDFEAFIMFLKDIALNYGVVTNHPMVPWQDLEKWTLYCMKTHKCCVTGENNAEIYWVDKPSYNSYEAPRVKKYRRMSLSISKTEEIETIGYNEFLKKYPTCIAIRCKLEGES